LIKAHRKFWLVLGLTITGASLLAHQLGAQSLWLDEFFSMVLTCRNWPGVIRDSIYVDSSPPLFNLLLHVALQLGPGEVAARALSCIFSIAVPVFYVLARLLFDRRIAPHTRRRLTNSTIDLGVFL